MMGNTVCIDYIVFTHIVVATISQTVLSLRESDVLIIENSEAQKRILKNQQQITWCVNILVCFLPVLVRRTL